MSAEQQPAIPPWKSSLIDLALQSSILTFAGPYTLKSGRQSPYFINCGLFSKGYISYAISTAYANTLHAHSQQHPDFTFDVLFGPAYKGIPLAATTSEKIAVLDKERYGQVGYTFNRKEVKDHGEGGLMVGEGLKGKRVVVIDDVMTAGTAIREAITIIKSQGGTLVGIVVAVDREEKMPSQNEKDGKGDDGSEGERGSTIGEVRRETGVPVLAVLTLSDVIEGMRGLGRSEEVKAMESYREKYGARD